MSLGSGFLENIPHFTFTPTEHQVECVKVAGARNLTFVLTKPQEKSFLVLMLVREVAQCVRNGAGKAALLLYNANQVKTVPFQNNYVPSKFSKEGFGGLTL